MPSALAESPPTQAPVPDSVARLEAARSGQLVLDAEKVSFGYSDKPLIDKYDVYQHLLDYWAETMQDDCYLIAADGWLAGARPREILQVKNRDGMPYVGHGITGYDPVKKAYVQTWVDGWSPVMSHVQAHFNAAGNLLTWAGETHDAATGRRTPLKMTTEFQGADVHVFTMYGADPSGQEFAMMTITYRRKK